MTTLNSACKKCQANIQLAFKIQVAQYQGDILSR